MTPHDDLVEEIARVISRAVGRAVDETSDFADWHWQENIDDARAILSSPYIAKLIEGEREECCKLIYGYCESDNVAERTVRAIRARSTAKEEDV